MKKRTWILIFSGLFLLGISGTLILPRISTSATYAEIYQDNQLICTVDLSVLTEPKEIPLQSGDRENIIVAERGKIHMKSANCPDKLCVHQGAIQNGVCPIVCLPNRVVIQIRNSKNQDTDTVSR